MSCESFYFLVLFFLDWGFWGGLRFESSVQELRFEVCERFFYFGFAMFKGRMG